MSLKQEGMRRTVNDFCTHLQLLESPALFYERCRSGIASLEPLDRKLEKA